MNTQILPPVHASGRDTGARIWGRGKAQSGASNTPKGGWLNPGVRNKSKNGGIAGDSKRIFTAVSASRAGYQRQAGGNLSAAVSSHAHHTGAGERQGVCPIVCGDRMAAIVDKIVDLEREVDQEIDKLQEIRRRVQAAIDAVPNGSQRSVLTLRYIHGLKFEEIAVKLTYHYRWVFELHGRGLRAVENTALKCTY